MLTRSADLLDMATSSRNATHATGISARQQARLMRPATGQSRMCLFRIQSRSRSDGPSVSNGLGLLEWTGKLLPQGALVTGAKQGWRLAWETMVRELAPQSRDGAYTRPGYSFKGRIGDPSFPAESGRYHLYVGNACPWCHRVLLALALRGLASHISVSQLADVPERATRGGWVFDQPDPVFGARDLWEVYDKLSPGFRGRCTAPLLVDKRTQRAVSNESADIIRMLDDVQLPGCSGVQLAPEALRGELDALNAVLYDSINNGVYKSGFCTTQAAYDRAQQQLWAAMEDVEARLSRRRFLLGDRFTEADLRLFPTIVRFDAVYAGLFKCGRKRVADLPNLQGWLRDVWQLTIPGSALQVRDTINVDAARQSYYTNLFPLNPSLIVPVGPTQADLQLDAPHNRTPAGARLEDTFWVRPVAAYVS